MPRQHQFTFETRPANTQELALAMSYGTETKISSKYHCQVIGTFARGNVAAKRISKNQNITLHPSVSRLPGLFPRTLFSLPSFFSLLSSSSSPSLHFSLSIYLSDRPSFSHACKYRNSDSFFLRSARVPAISPRPRLFSRTLGVPIA